MRLNHDLLRSFLEVLIVGLLAPLTYAALDDNRQAMWIIGLLQFNAYVIWRALRAQQLTNLIHNPSFESSAQGWTHNYFAPPPPRRTIRVTWYDDNGNLRRRSI